MVAHCSNQLLWKCGLRRIALMLLMASSYLNTALGAAPTEEERYLAGLRNRQLFRLAEAYCQEQLDRADLAPRRRVTLVVEQSRNVAQHAMSSPGENAAARWQQAIALVDDFARESADDPLAVLAEVQGATVRLLHGETLAEPFLDTSKDEAAREAPRGELRDAIERFARLQSRLAELQRRAAEQRGSQSADALTAGELRSLERHVRFEQARAFMLQAQTYGRGTPDWTNSLAQATELLAPLAQIATSEQLGWRSRLMQVECLRLAGEANEARRRLELIHELQPPADVQMLAQAEELRLAIAGRRLDDLESILGEITPSADSPEQLDLALLETYLVLWQDASRRRDEGRAAPWRQAAEALLAKFETRHGSFWRRRAEGLLVTMIGSSPQAADPAVLARLADAYYSQGRADEALATYDRAREVADQRGDANFVFDLAFKAAAVEHTRDAHVPARERFRALALAQPRHTRAAEAHALAIFHAAQELKRAAKDADAAQAAQERYVALIEEHLAQWPKSPTAADAAWRLGRLHEHARAWEPAIAAYRHIAPGQQQYGDALEAIGRCYSLEIEERTARGKASAAVATNAAEYFAAAAQGNATLQATAFAAQRRVAALWAARFWIGHLRTNYEHATELLTAASAGGGVPLEWRNEAVPLLIVALAAQGRHDEAQRLVGEAASASTGETMAMLDGLARIANSATDETAAAIATIEIDAARHVRARSESLDAASARRLDLLLAAALAQVGRHEEAETLYRALAKANPDQGDIQEEFARWLSSRGDEKTMREALTRWGEIEQRSRPGTDRWYRAKYGQAEAMYRLGDTAHALRLIKVTQTLYPKLGGPELKARFENLLAACQQPN